jgi:hypothetical protein
MSHISLDHNGIKVENNKKNWKKQAKGEWTIQLFQISVGHKENKEETPKIA